MSKYPEQAAEIQRLMKSANMTQEDLAERAMIEPQTVRKVAMGYQKCSERVMQSIRNAVEAANSNTRRKAAGLVAAASELQEESAVYGRKLEALKLVNPEVARSVAQIIDSSLGAVSSELNAAVEASGAAGLAALREEDGSPGQRRKPQAGGTSGGKCGRGGDAGEDQGCKR